MSLFVLFPATASDLAVAMLTCAISSTFNFVYDGCGQGTSVLPKAKKHCCREGSSSLVNV